MPLPRAPVRSTARWVAQSTKSGSGSWNSVWIWQQFQRRAYASQGPTHGAHKSSSDVPWMIGSSLVFFPSAYYLIQSRPETSHGHGHEHGDGDDHGNHGAEEHDGQDQGEQPAGEEQETGDGDEQSADESEKSEEKPDDSGSDTGQQETPSTSDDESSKNVAHVTDSGKDVEGVQFKGATSGGTREGEQGDTRKHIPDAKGGNKKRIESDYGHRLGVAVGENPEPDKPAASQAPGKDQVATMSGKQEGLSNTDTKHSTDIASNPEKSKKGEGTPETAKLKGTVRPSRPQAENRPGPEETSENTR